MTKKNTNLLIVGVLLLAVVSMVACLFGPAIADMYGAFPENEASMNFFVSGATFFSLLMMLLCPAMAKKIGSRNLLILGAIISAVGGVVGLLSFNITVICVAQSLACIGYGITGTMGISVLMQVITDEKQRGTINGINQVVIAASGAVLAFAGGAMAVNSWKTPVTANWIVLVVLGLAAAALIARALPKTIELSAEEEADEGDRKSAPWKAISVMTLGFLLLGICYQCINLFMAFYVEENGLGNAMFTGTLQSLGTVGSAICCAAFGMLYGKMGKKTIVLPLVVMAAFTFLMFLVPNTLIAMIAATLMGASFGCSVTYFYTICPEVAPKHITLAVSWIGIALNVPYMVGSYILMPMMGAMGSMTATLSVFAVVLAVEAVIAALIVFKKQK